MSALGHEQGRRVVLVFTDGKDTPGIGTNVSFEEVLSRAQAEEVMVYGIGFADACDPDDTGTHRWIPSGGRGGGVWYQRGGARTVPGTAVPRQRRAGPTRHPGARTAAAGTGGPRRAD